MKYFLRNRILIYFIMLFVLVVCGRAEPLPGLTVKDGLFCKDGKPFYGVGINYFSCFIRMTGMSPGAPQLNNRDYVEGFRILKSYDIPFVRFCAGGFWPNDWKLYQTDKKTYFKLFDDLVAEAEKQGIGLIPSFFWTYSTVPDLVNETIDQWGNPDSRTITFMRQYTTEMVSRYTDSPAIWAWEFGNEYLHEVDLPQPEFGRGWIAPEFGTPAVRSEKDKMFRRNIYVAYREFEKAIRAIDQTRPLLTGDVMPRPSGWHNWKHGTWDPDSAVQWKEVFLSDNPFVTLAAHFYYYNRDEEFREVGVMQYDSAQQMQFLMEISREAGKPLFIGEFGSSPDRSLAVDTQLDQFRIMLNLIRENGVQLAALWNYDFEHEDQHHCNITTSNERFIMLDLLEKVNNKMQASGTK